MKQLDPNASKLTFSLLNRSDENMEFVMFAAIRNYWSTNIELIEASNKHEGIQNFAGYAAFRKWLTGNAVRIYGMRMIVERIEQFDLPFEIIRSSPFGEYDYAKVFPNLWKNTNALIKTQVDIINFEAIIACDTEWRIELLPNQRVTFIMNVKDYTSAREILTERKRLKQ